MAENLLLAALGFAAAFVMASFVEWFVHLLMHRRILLGKIHYDHHLAGAADGMIWEFLYYLPAAIIGSAIFAAGGWYWNCPWLAGGECLGSFAYAFFAGYAHQIQHERPELVFWMHPPVHTVHHKHEMYRRNFGIGLDVWDKVFGTYQHVEWQPDPARQRTRLSDFIRIKWC